MLLVFPSNLHLYYIDEVVNLITSYLYDEPMHGNFRFLARHSFNSAVTSE